MAVKRTGNNYPSGYEQGYASGRKCRPRDPIRLEPTWLLEMGDEFIDVRLRTAAFGGRPPARETPADGEAIDGTEVVPKTPRK